MPRVVRSCARQPILCSSCAAFKFECSATHAATHHAWQEGCRSRSYGNSEVLAARDSSSAHSPETVRANGLSDCLTSQRVQPPSETCKPRALLALRSQHADMTDRRRFAVVAVVIVVLAWARAAHADQALSPQ